MTAAELGRASELYAAGLSAHGRGHLRQALRLLRRAEAAATGLEADGGPDRDRVQHLLAAISISIAATTAETQGVERGREALDIAGRRVARLDDPALQVKVHSQRAFIAARTGDYDTVLSELDAAEALVEHADANEQFGILLNGGMVRMFRGDTAGARRRFERAVARARALDMPHGVFKALHNLGYVEFLAGRLPNAIRAMDEAGALDVDVSRGIWLLDRARVLGEAGLVQQADSSLADAAAIFAADRDAQDLAETELERARCALVLGETDAARRLAMRARDRFRRRGSDRWRRSAELVLLQGDLAAGRPGSRLAGPALRLRAEFLREGVTLPARTAALIAAEAHLAAGQPEAARDVLADLGRAARSDPITARLHTHYVRARLEAVSGRPAAATRRVRTALDELVAYQASFGSVDLATAAAVHGRRLAELDLAIALDTGDPAKVLAAAERGRAATNRLTAVRPPADPVAAELLSELRSTVEALRASEQDRAASAPLLARRRDLEARIAARGWAQGGSAQVTAVVDTETVRGALGDVTLVSYSRLGAALHALVVSAQHTLLVALGPAAGIDEQVRRVRADLDVLAQPQLPAPLRASITASLTRSLAALDAALLAPLDAPGRLVVVSTGVLGQLPWGLLPSRRGVPVVVTPSATAWHRAHTAPQGGRARPREAPAVAALAGPELARGADEARAVAQVWGTAALTGAQATAAAFSAALSGARIAHVAAHGVHETENPLFSSVRLVDGPLFAHELDRTAGAPEHVVLSACELGLATVRPGDEALGLTSVLLRLGTRSVVAGVARVGDDAAASAMTGYHRGLHAGADSAGALAAVLEAHPLVPFVCFGATFSV